MQRTYHLRNVTALLETVSYPITREELRREAGDATLVHDQRERLAAVLGRVDQSLFVSVDDLELSIIAALDRRPIEEPAD